MKRSVCVALLLPCLASAAGAEVRFPGPGLELVGRLYLPEGAAKAPAVVLLHGCSGLWARNGAPTQSYQAWAEHLQRRGFAALLVDSFGPRGEREICTQKQRRISEAVDRPRDAHAALRWLSSRPDIKAESIHVLGWSNGERRRSTRCGPTRVSTTRGVQGSGPASPFIPAALRFPEASIGPKLHC